MGIEWILIGGIVLLVGAVGGLVYMDAKKLPKALIGFTAAGAVVVIPYAVTSDSDVGIAIDPATGQTTTTINGIGVNPHTGAVVSNGFNTSTGQLQVTIPLDEDEYLDDRKQGMTQDLLAEEGIKAREADVAAPAGFRKEKVEALLVQPERGETTMECFQRVHRALQRRGVEAQRFEPAESEGLASRVRR